MFCRLKRLADLEVSATSGSDEQTNASSSMEEAIGGVHGRKKIFVSDTEFLNRLGRECDIDRFR